MPREDRGLWAEGLGIKPMELMALEFLFYVGCTPSYDPRGESVIVPLPVQSAQQRRGLDFGILGADESCCGSEVRRLGEGWAF